MKTYFGNTKQDQRVEVGWGENLKEFNILLDGKKIASYNKLETAEKNCRRLILKSYISSPEEVENILESNIKLIFDYPANLEQTKIYS